MVASYRPTHFTPNRYLMPSTDKVTVFLPRDLLAVVQRVCAERHYSRSELFREGLRMYLLPPYEATIEEREAIASSIAEVSEGNSVRLESREAIADELGLTDK